MAVAYRHRLPPAPPEHIERLQQRLGRPLPAAYLDYLGHQDGGQLADNTEVVNIIFGLGDVPDWANLWHKLETFHDRIPAWLLLVAQDAFGNLFALSLRDQDLGSVWFWDHEEEADEGEPPTEDNLTLKAPDWQTFLDSLRPLG
jgi:hypothetical protein